MIIVNSTYEPTADEAIYGVKDARPETGYRVEVSFTDGKRTTVDFEPFLKAASHPDIRKYRDIELFRSFRIIDGNLNWGDYDMIFPVAELYAGRISVPRRQA